MKEVRVEETDNQHQRARSGSFGSSIRRIFSSSKSTAPTRRGGSLNRPAQAAQGDVTVKRESSVPAAGTKDTLSPYGQHLTPAGAGVPQEGGYHRPRQSTPVPPSRDGSSMQHGARWDSWACVVGACMHCSYPSSPRCLCCTPSSCWYSCRLAVGPGRFSPVELTRMSAPCTRALQVPVWYFHTDGRVFASLSVHAPRPPTATRPPCSDFQAAVPRYCGDQRLSRNVAEWRLAVNRDAAPATLHNDGHVCFTSRNLYSPMTHDDPIITGVGAQSTLGQDIFARKLCEKN